MVNLHEAVRANRRRSVFIVLLFFFFIVSFSGLAGVVFSISSNGFDPASAIALFIVGGVVGLFVASIYIAVVFAEGPNMIMSASGAKLASRENYPFLYHTTEALALSCGLGKSVPACYVIEDKAPNAYATGFSPEKSYIVVTTGLMEMLNRQELEGVLAHEMSHIVNRDIKVMLLATALVGATVLLADVLFRVFIHGAAQGGGGGNGKKGGGLIIILIVAWVVLIVLSPLIAKMIQLAISRRREFLADSNGALLTRYPEGLASALEKIKNDAHMLKRANKAMAHLFISNPFDTNKHEETFLERMFSTHPPLSVRIAKLRGKNV